MSRDRVLIIDDEEDICKLIRRILVPQGYEVLSAKTGRDGLEQAHKIPPHLAILDLAMPGLNGIDVYKLLRSSPKTKDVPILIVTGLGDLSHVLKSAAEGLGAQAFLPKPFTPEELLWHVNQLARSQPSQTKPHPSVSSFPQQVPTPCLLRRGRVCMDIASHQVWAGGRQIEAMGPKRFKLLHFLLQHPEGARREQLLYQVWDGEGDYKMVDVMVHRLKHSLRANGKNRMIVPIPDGYKLVG